jgi:predicted DCC family thiol-disulfide oxidoreductase YuxK
MSTRSTSSRPAPDAASATAERVAPVLFYDGTCGLCARSVQWSLRHDARGVLRFAPLQGPTYAALPAADKPREVETMVLRDGDGLHLRSDAVLRLLRHIGGFWSVLAIVGRACPRPVRDALYRFVAAHRIAWFGTADSCALPAPAERERFLA